MGHITEWVGAPGAGQTSALWALIGRLRQQGRAVAWIDQGRSLMARDWIGEGVFWAVRPPSSEAFTIEQAVASAEVILQSRSFDLVVLDLDPAERKGVRQKQATRLQRLARQAQAALVLLRGPEREGVISARRLEFEPDGQAEAEWPGVPLAWSVRVHSTRGAPQPARHLTLTEPVTDRLTAWLVPADRGGAA